MKRSDHLRSSTSTIIQEMKALRLPQETVFTTGMQSKRRGTGSRNAYAGVSIDRPVRVPVLTQSDIEEIERGEHPETVTRLIDAKYLDSWMGGFFRFGTIRRYRSEEAVAVGRLGDHTEGLQRNFYNNSSGKYSQVSVDGITINGLTVKGGANDVEICHTVNCYCSCVMTGELTEDGVRRFRAEGNGDIGAYVTYNLKALKKAITNSLHDDPVTSRLKLVSRAVTYDHRDYHIDSTSGVIHEGALANPKEVWLGTAFYKPPVFDHEREYRMLLINPLNAAGLREDAVGIDLNSSEIAAAIISGGTL